MAVPLFLSLLLASHLPIYILNSTDAVLDIAFSPTEGEVKPEIGERVRVKAMKVQRVT